MFPIMIFGAKSIALGVSRAMRELYGEFPVTGFLVTSLSDNPSCLDGLPVCETGQISDKSICILIATPEDTHPAIVQSLEEQGFYNYVAIDGEKESELMRRYYEKRGLFRSLKGLPPREGGQAALNCQIYMARFHKDKPLSAKRELPSWLIPIQVGAAGTEQQIARILDSEGENISSKNGNYSELTALYWLWKNKLCRSSEAQPCLSSGEQPPLAAGRKQPLDYTGLCHYRRWLDVRESDWGRIAACQVDVILPYPTIHEPDIREHHARYMKESDWEAGMEALRELAPEDYEASKQIFLQEYLYNYNILIAKPEVLRRYCQWLFPILERTEELSEPRGRERSDRYIGYIGENLLTLYFMRRKEELNIVYTGRQFLV